MSAFINQQRAAGFAVELTCRTLGTSASAYYHRATGQPSTRAQEDAVLLEQIRAVYRANYEAYGSLRVWKALRRQGVEVGRGRVERLMAADGLIGAKRRGRAWKTTVPDPAGCERPDLVNRQFTAARPDALWIADFTYLKSWEGVGFFSFVLDVYSRRVVGWQLASHMRTDLVLDALKMALGTRRHGADLQLIHHSDRGSQYTSFDFTQALQDNDVLGSLGSTGDAYDNAMAESFVDSFKTELIRDRVWQARTQLELAVVERVGWYNYDRLHSALGHLPSVEFETLYAIRSGSPLPR
ncbi:MAG: subunit of transposase [Conexibacter sp.]|nr:subunit of transposase [Conexibacter sp.]